MQNLKDLSIFASSNRSVKRPTTIDFRRKPKSKQPLHWRERAKRQRSNKIDPRSMADNAAMYALAATLFDAMCKLERKKNDPSLSYASNQIDQLLEAAECHLGAEAPVMGPLYELFKQVEAWQKEHLVDETTLVEMLLARVAIGLGQVSGVNNEHVFSKAFARAYDGLPPSLRV